ncbi:Siderophore-interacting protein [Alcanivorax hongdengensis A-11-3]|uniref:Siderophore-interacting protein n=2 Tax=Alcanivorax hongdengensis TaxID=519051 RepID=L0WGC8_9GAMM|nr:Siderophore-interacting protein [Alcanivorax hongdengensis A-11-3]
MKRVVLGGDNLDDFPEGHESANFKLLIPRPGQATIARPPFGDLPEHERPVVRTYTLRHFDRGRGEVVVDFMMHSDHGPASHWAATARPGDRVGFAGPGQPKWVDLEADWFLFAGDMSALPAIAANIERLPRGAKGHAVLEIMDPADKQPLPFPPGLQVHWLLNPTPSQPSTALVDAVIDLPWQAGSPSVWVAGESGAVRAIRRYLVSERDIPRRRLYASGYWQIGMTEDVHQVAKRKAP